ncbi:MAG: ferritin family protein [Candidatus Omnitrophica bacterium]|nr:ferritin family protein [Candidatus Omnitrophota bacterium]
MPDNLFNAAEVVDMGIAKEVKRRDFYALVAKRFKEKEMQELFSRLRDWEDEHIKKFTDIRNTIEDSEITESYQGEFQAYIRSLVDDMQYKQVSAESFDKFVKNPVDAINYGMGFERDAILFFGELAAHMTPAHKEKVSRLIEEERKHLMYLAKLKAGYK